MSKELIKYLYQTGVYTIEEMINLVYRRELSEEDFYDITGKKGTQLN